MTKMMMIYLSIIVGVVALAALGVRYWGQAPSSDALGIVAEVSARKQEVDNLTVAEARARLEEQLRAGDFVSHRIGDALADELGLDLPPTVIDFCQRYGEIRRPDDEGLLVGASTIGTSRYVSGCIKVGYEDGGLTEVLVEPGRDTVYESDHEGEALDSSNAFESIYHWLLMQA